MSATQLAGSSVPCGDAEVKSSAPSDSDLSDTVPLSKSMKHVLRQTPARVSAKSGGSRKRGLPASSEQNPIDVDDLPETDHAREERRLRRRLGSLREKSVTSRAEPSSPSSGSTQKVDPSLDSGLQDCPVSADADLSKADADLSKGDPPSKAVSGTIVNFTPSSFGVPPGLVRTVDLPFDSVVEEGKKDVASFPPLSKKPDLGKLSAHSAFRRQVYGDSVDPKPVEVVSENKDVPDTMPVPPVAATAGESNFVIFVYYFVAY